MSKPEHHKRYARAWDLYQDKTLDHDTRTVLETEMDDAQEDFTMGEFMEFRETLPKFCAFWDAWGAAHGDPDAKESLIQAIL